jgi:GT2 family glycosyltransferase
VRNEGPGTWWSSETAVLFWSTPGGARRIGELPVRRDVPPTRVYHQATQVEAPPDDAQGLLLRIGTAMVQVPIHLMAPEDYAHGGITATLPRGPVAPGEPLAIELLLRNDGPAPWRGTKPHALEVTGAVGAVRISQAIEVDVPPGQTVPAAITIPMPWAEGSHTIRFSLNQPRFLSFDQVASFRSAELVVEVAARTSPKARGASAPAAAVEWLGVPPRLIAGEPQPAIAVIRNLGADCIASLAGHPLVLRQSWLRPEAPQRLGVRVDRRIEAQIPAGATEPILVDLHPPRDGGVFRLELLLGQPTEDGVFENLLATSPPVEVEVLRERDIGEEAGPLSAALRREAQATRREAYRLWAEAADTLDAAAVREVARQLAGWSGWPRVSLVTRLSGSADGEALGGLLSSLQQQIFAGWDLVVLYDPRQPLAAELLAAPEAEPRLRLVASTSEGAGPLLREALGAARGEILWLLSPGDRLPVHALAFAVAEFARSPGLSCLYADFDHLGADGARRDPVRLSFPDPDTMLSHGSLWRALLLRARQLARIRVSPDVAWPVLPHHLLGQLAAEAAPGEIAHLPCILLHAGPGGPDPAALAADAQAHLESQGGGRASWLDEAAALRLRRPLPDPAPHVTVIVPTRDGLHLLRPCVTSLLDRTDYPSFDLIVVDNGSEEAETLDYLDRLARSGQARVLRDDGPFNWSRLNNRAVAASRGEMLCLLNNDTEVLNEPWLREMVAEASRPGIGVVGAALWYPDGTLQHGGVGFDPADGRPIPLLRGLPRGAVPARMRVARRVAAVIGACMVTPRKVYDAVGGMDEANLPIGYNDIDYCLRVQERLGLATLWTPFAELLHRESATRGPPRSQAGRDRQRRDISVFEARWVDAPVRQHPLDPLLSPASREYRRPAAPALIPRLGWPTRRPLCVMHVPRTAGVALRERLRTEMPGLVLGTVSARSLLGCEAGEAAALERTAALLRRLDVLIARVSHGFGARLGWACAYATLLRDPVERAWSQYRHLLHDASSPLLGTPLAGLSFEAMLRKGIIAGNLLVRKILGEPPESVTWQEVDGVGADFAGFVLPPELWHRRGAALLDRPDVLPDEDMAKVDRAFDILMRDFAFVGRQESLDEDLGALVAMLGGPRDGRTARVNAAPRQEGGLTNAEREVAHAYHRLDAALVARVAALPGGRWLNPGLLER